MECEVFVNDLWIFRHSNCLQRNSSAQNFDVRTGRIRYPKDEKNSSKKESGRIGKLFPRMGSTSSYKKIAHRTNRSSRKVPRNDTMLWHFLFQFLYLLPCLHKPLPNQQQCQSSNHNIHNHQHPHIGNHKIPHWVTYKQAKHLF